MTSTSELPQRVSGVDIIEGTFQPKVTDDLTPAGLALVGKRLKWSFAWVAEEGDPYAGQAIWQPVPPMDGIRWVPDEDIQR